MRKLTNEMRKLTDENFEDKYNNFLELVQETGKISVALIDDGEVEAVQTYFKKLGYTSRLDPSTDYLILEKEEQD